jgi:hypothetical protein
MLTYDPSLSQHVQRAYVTLVDVLPRKSTASLSQLPATGKRRSSLSTQLLEKNYLPINTVAPSRYVITYSHFVPSMSQNKKMFPKNFEVRGFCPTHNFRFPPEGFSQFFEFRAYFALGMGLFHLFYFRGLCSF